jgi:hypothetical protein
MKDTTQNIFSKILLSFPKLHNTEIPRLVLFFDPQETALIGDLSITKIVINDSYNQA